jgi:DNA modification methylase
VIIPHKLLGDARAKLAELPENSFQLCVTSPPYWGLRSYLPANHPLKHLEIGTEDTLEQYLANLVEVFTAVHRVLRDDGLLWVNMGDRWTAGSRRQYDRCAKIMGRDEKHPANGVFRPMDPPGLKIKELCLLPQRVAIALQESGWYLRCMCPWIKRNCMPESVKDRPVNALEYFFMFSKQRFYYYDRDAVTVRASDNTHPRAAVFPHRETRNDNNRRRRRTNPKAALAQIGVKQNPSFQEATSDYLPSRRNWRNTDLFMQSWEGLLGDENGDPLALVVNPKGTTMSHYASYPVSLIRPIIQASTSEGGCCSNCGAPRIRVVEVGEADIERQRQCGGDLLGEYHGQAKKDFKGNGVQDASDVKRRILAGMRERKTVGWNPGCTCDRDQMCSLISKPCSVIDPFHGTGTTAQACVELGRHYTGIEISEDYFKDSDRKDSQTALSIV